MKTRYTLVPEPLPGTTPLPHGLFVDRWGTLLERPLRGFVTRFSEARFTPGAVDGLYRACQAGWRIYLIGNEDAVARGKVSDEAWAALERGLLAHLASQGIAVARSYACLDHPKGKGKHRRDSVFLLPNTGALYHASQEDGIALGESWVIGDESLELSAGWRAGCRTAGVQTGQALLDGAMQVEPDLVAPDLAHVLAEILATERIIRR